jgi:hypothetical protein
MGKLDEISRKGIFDTPENYFKELPSRIHTRITAKHAQEAGALRLVWRLSLPLLLLVAVSIYYFLSRPSDGASSILATVQTYELVQFLDESELPTDDLIETAQFTVEDVSEIEKEVYNYNVDEYQLEDNLNTP